MERTRTGVANQNADLERQGCSPFYEELFDDPYVNTVNFTISPSFWLSSVCVFLLQLYLFIFSVSLCHSHVLTKSLL